MKKKTMLLNLTVFFFQIIASVTGIYFPLEKLNKIESRDIFSSRKIE